MLGAIVGDVVGSVYEFNNIKSKDFPFFTKENFFTDDTIMTCAVCQALMNCKGEFSNLQKEAKKCLLDFGRKYVPNGKIGYGQMFLEWLKDPMPYQSWGNGACMRVSPVAYFAKDENQLKAMSRDVTIVSHNHEEAIKGAEATALCVFMALNGATKEEIKERIEREYYSLDFSYKELVKNFTFHVDCKNTVPQAIFCFLISESFEDSIRTAISIGGDSDTLAAVTGSIAEAFYGVPETFERHALKRLDKNLNRVFQNFCQNEFSFYKHIHKSDPLSEFDFKNFVRKKNKFLKDNKEENFVILNGEGDFMLSAPHGVSQVRLGKPKFAEPGSLALALDLKDRTGVHMIAKTKNCNDDANFDNICPYKDRLKRYIEENHIKYLIDIHGMKKSRDIDINLGVFMGFNIRPNEPLFDFLCEELKAKGFVYEIDSPFWGKAGTVSGTIAQELGIWTLQLEVNYKYTSDSKYQSRLVDIIDCLVKTINKTKIE